MPAKSVGSSVGETPCHSQSALRAPALRLRAGSPDYNIFFRLTNFARRTLHAGPHVAGPIALRGASWSATHSVIAQYTSVSGTNSNKTDSATKLIGAKNFGGVLPNQLVQFRTKMFWRMMNPSSTATANSAPILAPFLYAFGAAVACQKYDDPCREIQGCHRQPHLQQPGARNRPIERRHAQKQQWRDAGSI